MNLLLIVLDSLRQDHVGCYGNDWIKTPNIDKFASESIVFTRCWSESLPTIPVRRALHTGKRTFPWHDRPRPKGIYNRHQGWRPLPEEDVTLAEHLQPLGYITGLVADTYHIFKPAMNFHRYFNSFEWIRGQEYDQWRSGKLKAVDLDHYQHPNHSLSVSLMQYLQNQSKRKAEEDYQSPRVFRAAMECLEDNADHEKFFLWVDSFDPHEPWEAPKKYVDLYDPGYEGREFIDPRGIPRSDMTEAEYQHVRALYAAEVTMVDHWLGRFLDKLDEVGRRDDTVLLLLSDHGKIIGEFDSFGMSANHTSRALYAVPCMIRHPKGIGAGTRVESWAYNIDVMRTAVRLLGVDPLPEAQGIDLWPTVQGGPPVRDHFVGCYNNIACVWQDDWLYLQNTDDGTEQIYNLAADPERQNNLARSEADLRNEMSAKLDAVMRG